MPAKLRSTSRTSKTGRTTGTIVAAMAVTFLSLSGCSGTDAATPSPETAGDAPVTEQTRTATGEPAADRDKGPLITQIRNNKDGAPGSLRVQGVTTDSETIEFEVACDREDNITVEVAQVGFVEMGCPTTEGLRQSITMDISGLEQDMGTGERELQITATGTEGTVWEVTVTKADPA